MKNILLIDLDTERENPIEITKPEDMVSEISDEESAKKMILDDMTTVCNAMGTLIQLGDDNGYFSSEKSAKMCIKYLEENFLNNENTNNTSS